MFSDPSIIKPPSLPRNCDHIREVAFGKMDYMYLSLNMLNAFIVAVAKILGHIIGR